MSFYTPELGIEFYDDIPVVCSQCASQRIVQRPTQLTKKLLVDASGFHSLSTELRLLQRITDLIALFPDTRHPLIHYKRGSASRRSSPDEDPRVEHMLTHDPELYQFLQDCSFDLDSRKSFVETRVKTLRFVMGHPNIACSECKAYCYLPQDFLDEVGHYIDRITEEGG